jgi:hypothetical protein
VYSQKSKKNSKELSQRKTILVKVLKVTVFFCNQKDLMLSQVAFIYKHEQYANRIGKDRMGVVHWGTNSQRQLQRPPDIIRTHRVKERKNQI